VTDELPKPRYEPPIMIDLGIMAKGKGYCAAGPLDTGGEYCSAGESNQIGYCSAGYGNMGTYCSAGTANQRACSAGPSPVL
jgi:hypothetical protein